MTTFTFIRRCELPVPVDEAFAWHARPGAFERLLPPWERVELLRREGGIEDGAITELSMRIGPVSVRWRAEHFGFEPNRQFCDRQTNGPFAFWEHTHSFLPGGASSCTMEDRIEYRPPLGKLGSLLSHRSVERKLARMFDYRHQVTQADLADHARFRDRAPLRIALTGATGLVGKELTAFLTTGGHQVIPLKRGSAVTSNHAQTGQWNVETGEITLPDDQPLDALIHLAGESIASGRWTPEMKQRIRESRVEATRRLAEALARMPNKPTTFLCASAIGFYGDRGDERLSDISPAGGGFLADVCRHWEAATQVAHDAGIRVAHARFGMILSPRGGALAKMLTPFQLGGGGPIGSGRQIWSWIAIDDVIGALHHVLMNEQIVGPINLVAPHAVSSKQFARILGRVLHRPAIFPTPAAAVRLALGEMADELLLASTHVLPRRLLDTGYRFRFADLEAALRHLQGR